jgi:ribosomal-protein-alanine N-acetyltransferase
LIEVRPACRTDAQALAMLHAEGFPGRSWSPDFFAEAAEAARDILLCAGEPLSGFIMMRNAGDEAEILTIAASPPGEGLGTALLNEGITSARSYGARSLFLEVSTANKAARQLYRRAGFIEVGRRRAYYDDGTDALVLRRDLSGKE